MIVNCTSTEKRLAIIEEEQVVEIKIAQPGTREHIGDIYVGRITDVIPGMQAVFVDIGTGKNGYLHRDQLVSYHLSPLTKEQKKDKSVSSFASQGQEILVQVVKEGVGGKGPRLTEMVELSGSHLVYMPKGKQLSVSKKMRTEEEREKWRRFGEQVCNEEEGVIFRTSCENQHDEIVLQELTQLRATAEEIVTRQRERNKPGIVFEALSMVRRLLQDENMEKITELIVDDFEIFQELKREYPDKIQRYQRKENIFTSYGIDLELEKALHKKVTCKNGSYIIIEKTEACTVIDVNSGKFKAETSQRDTALLTNIEAAKEIARQLRLRNIGGIVLVDFIDMKNVKDQQKVIDSFKEVAKKDRLLVRVLGFTALGILEITRQKTNQSLSEILQSPCYLCNGTGKSLSIESMYYQMERQLLEYHGSDYEAAWIEVTPELREFIDKKKRKPLEEKLSLSIFITERYNGERGYHIRHLGSVQEVQNRVE
ncbi:Rne/Rng family ribonuclease [Litchfieldia alkalitelluris]|uniref:Rne/Rng family ribonuclease n=1 Tax=Litchfieldia alkalitelluris TaxID=304268 RepID=UPI001F19709A|nr:Rne/Rng family ribonuclease [Litchfieldia alkalitelluris]